MAGPIDSYRKVRASQDVSSYQAVRLLLDGAIERIALARLASAQANSKLRGEAVSGAIAIVSALQCSLDKDLGGELALNLDNLYDYINRRLVGVVLGGAEQRLEETQALLGEIRDAWTAIGSQVEPAGS